MSYSAVANPVKTISSLSQPMVDVVAPATLAEGYQFQAISNGTPFIVTVPPGGVKEGQTFSVPFSPTDQVITAESTPMVGGKGAIGDDLDMMPHGVWKDGLCGCLNFGLCHPSLCNAIFCQLVLAGQVLTRLHRNWLSLPAEPSAYKNTTKIMLALTIIYCLVAGILQPKPDQELQVTPSGDLVVVDVGDPSPLWQVLLFHFCGLAFGLFGLYTIVNVRRAVREKYRIPEKQCSGMEDCCCAFWCACCTVAQAARHTANYEQRRALCCSDTGLPAPAPVLIV